MEDLMRKTLLFDEKDTTFDILRKRLDACKKDLTHKRHWLEKGQAQ